MEQQHLTAQQFGTAASAYLSSTVHAGGADLERLTGLARDRPAPVTLDLGCGAGHASFALARGGARRVIAYDLSPQMLEVVSVEARRRGHDGIETCRGPAEELPFPDASVGRVVSRFSAHHWLDVERAIKEMARVLAPGGSLVLVDVVAPEMPLLDTVLQTLELLRDSSHVRDYRESEWRRMLQHEGFDAPQVDRWRLTMEFESWVARIRTPLPRVAALKTAMDGLPAEASDYFGVTSDHSFAIDACWFATHQPSRG